MTEEIINKTKEKVAINNGFTTSIFGSCWQDAMMFTSRKKKQLELYEEVIELLAACLNTENTEQLTNTDDSHD